MASSRISVNQPEVEITVVDDNVNINVDETVATIEFGTTGPQGPRGTQMLSGPDAPTLLIGIIGDLYIQTDTGQLYGPKTESGWGVGIYLGVNDPNDLGQVYEQITPSATWTINHTLSFIPNILVVDSAGTEVEGDYNYVDADTIVATFSGPFAGKAYLS